MSLEVEIGTWSTNNKAEASNFLALDVDPEEQDEFLRIRVDENTATVESSTLSFDPFELEVEYAYIVREW